MSDDNDASKKAKKRRDLIIIIGLVAVFALILWLGSMDPAARYELIGL
ncbi:MAG: hypothetical protein MI824_25240 [Hyphomicrobiales bacterium]|nr:hypothetical protein [Hyphomicrobiales bacterium]